MKQVLIILLTFYSIICTAQRKLPIIKASSNKAQIYIEGNTTKGWNIDPKIKLDIFTTSKLVTSKTVKFKTDIDSINFKLKPGSKKDFIVLLNGKDSSFTRIQSPEIKNNNKIKPEINDTIALFINKQNTIYVKTILNKIDTLNLNFDTGTTELNITEEVLKNKVKSNPKFYDTYYNIEIGKRNYSSRVFPTVLTGHDTDGRFGWDLFDGMIVELNYDKMLMIVHSKLPKYVIEDHSFTKLNIKYFNNLVLVESQIVQSNVGNKDWFLFDTGYQRTAMLDNDLLKDNNFPTERMEVIKKVIMHGAKGNVIPVITSNLETLKIGTYELKNVPVQVLTENKPLRGVNIHILGNEVLKRFNTILDFQKNVIYLKPNHLFDDVYAEQRKNKV